jgi:hypothetical protein
MVEPLTSLRLMSRIHSFSSLFRAVTTGVECEQRDDVCFTRALWWQYPQVVEDCRQLR